MPRLPIPELYEEPAPRPTAKRLLAFALFPRHWQWRLLKWLLAYPTAVLIVHFLPALPAIPTRPMTEFEILDQLARQEQAAAKTPRPQDRPDSLAAPILTPGGIGGFKEREWCVINVFEPFTYIGPGVAKAEILAK